MNDVRGHDMALRPEPGRPNAAADESGMRGLRRSLSGRIALLVLGLMFVVAGGLSWMSYRAVRRQTADAFRERLGSLASQFAESGAAGPRETLARLTRLAGGRRGGRRRSHPGATGRAARALQVLRGRASPDRRSVLALMDTSGSGGWTLVPPAALPGSGRRRIPGRRAPHRTLRSVQRHDRVLRCPRPGASRQHAGRYAGPAHPDGSLEPHGGCRRRSAGRFDSIRSR